jgi:two-component system, cell cycle response regulator
MSAHILIVDTVAARRILLRASLASAHYHVTQTSDPTAAPALAMALLPDLVVVDLAESAAALESVAALRLSSGTDLPIIALAPPDRPQLRLAALEAGADEAMDQGTADAFLHARIRSLLRDRDAAEELRLREEDESTSPSASPAQMARAGFAEARALFQGAGSGRVAVLPVACGADASGAQATAMAGLPQALGCAVHVLHSPADLDGHRPAPDLVVIDGAAAGGPAAEAEVLRQLADLRSRSATRHAATLVVLPAAAVGTAALALDLGAGDVVTEEVGSDEVLARVRALIGRKSRADGLRDRIQSRLQAAVRDPLTGLHNRRFAEPVLVRMARRAEAMARDFAVMILDIDNFKAINDTFGHTAGDRVLAEVARRLRETVRPCDLVARIGGEEFLVAMPDSSVDCARAGAERLRRAVESVPFHVERAFAPASREGAAWGLAAAFGKGRGLGSSPLGVALGEMDRALRASPAQLGAEEIHVTLSIGVAVGGAGQGAPLGGSQEVADRAIPLDTLFEKADGALYAAKTAGRNTVAMALGAA